MTRLSARFVLTCRLACISAGILIWAGTLPATAQNPQKKLEALSEEIEDRKARQGALQAEAENLRDQQQKLRRRIIALARDLQNIDGERDRLENRLSELAVTENRLDEDLQRDRAALSQLLAGLQAMQTQPAPALPCIPTMRWPPCRARWR